MIAALRIAASQSPVTALRRGAKRGVIPSLLGRAGGHVYLNRCREAETNPDLQNGVPPSLETYPVLFSDLPPGPWNPSVVLPTGMHCPL